jgi:hypothetical protein
MQRRFVGKRLVTDAATQREGNPIGVNLKGLGM